MFVALLLLFVGSLREVRFGYGLLRVVAGGFFGLVCSVVFSWADCLLFGLVFVYG